MDRERARVAGAVKGGQQFVSRPSPLSIHELQEIDSHRPIGGFERSGRIDIVD